jgi:hypothetical protein
MSLSDETAKIDLDRPLWGCEAFAEVLNRNKRQVHHLLTQGRLDADKVGSLWVSTPRRLLKRIAGE